MQEKENLQNHQENDYDESQIQILEGLKENDNLVVKGFETLKENAKVKVQK